MKRSVLVAVLAWVAVVAAASALTWAVIGTAGQQALSGGQVSATDVVAGSPSRTATGPRASAGPPAPTPPVGSAGSATVERVWRGTAGTVVALCTGARLDLRSATPNDEYHVEVEISGTQELEVRFESGSDEVKVTGRCAGGAPRFSVESRAEDE